MADQREGFVSKVARRLSFRGEKVARPRPARFEVYGDGAGEFRWRLKAGNGEIVANGTEGYASRWKANRALGRVKELVLEAM